MGAAHCLGSQCWLMDVLPLATLSAWLRQVPCISFILLSLPSIILCLPICEYSVTILAQDVGGWGLLNFCFEKPYCRSKFGAFQFCAVMAFACAVESCKRIGAWKHCLRYLLNEEPKQTAPVDCSPGESQILKPVQRGALREDHTRSECRRCCGAVVYEILFKPLAGTAKRVLGKLWLEMVLSTLSLESGMP